MASNNLVIPQKLKIGFCKRKDALTDKLGYVIYFDEKGVLRKKVSWENWRDKDIEPLEVENIPMSGYVVNKGVTHFSYSSFGSDRFRVRVHSPLGFDFEIYPENLLAIMAVSDISKQYINNECVYAWDGQELVLLPVNTEQYKKAVENTERLKTIHQAKKKAGSNAKLKLEKGTVLFGTNDIWTYIDEVSIIPESYVSRFSLKNIKFDKNNKVVFDIPEVTQKIGLIIGRNSNNEVSEAVVKQAIEDKYGFYGNMDKIPDNALVTEFNINTLGKLSKQKNWNDMNSNIKKIENLIANIPENKSPFNIIEITKDEIDVEMKGNRRNYYYHLKETKNTDHISNFLSKFERSAGNDFEKNEWFTFVSKNKDLFKVSIKIVGKNYYYEDKIELTFTISIVKISGKTEEVVWEKTETHKANEWKSIKSKEMSDFNKFFYDLFVNNYGENWKHPIGYIYDKVKEVTGSPITLFNLAGITIDGKKSKRTFLMSS